MSQNTRVVVMIGMDSTQIVPTSTSNPVLAWGMDQAQWKPHLNVYEAVVSSSVI